jgi:hypothetical protein
LTRRAGHLSQKIFGWPWRPFGSDDNVPRRTPAADVIGNAVKVMRILTGEESEDREDAPAQQFGKLSGAARR